MSTVKTPSCRCQNHCQTCSCQTPSLRQRQRPPPNTTAAILSVRPLPFYFYFYFLFIFFSLSLSRARDHNPVENRIACAFSMDRMCIYNGAEIAYRVLRIHGNRDSNRSTRSGGRFPPVSDGGIMCVFVLGSLRCAMITMTKRLGRQLLRDNDESDGFSWNAR